MKTFYEYKRVLAGIGYTLLITSLAACDRGADSDLNASNAGASTGYNAGYELGIKLAMMREQQPVIELDEALTGLRDALLDTSQITSRAEFCARLQPTEARPAKNVQLPQFKPAEGVEPTDTEARMNRLMDFYAKDDYAALNAIREGVITLPSGVQYEVIETGSGEPPQASDAVLISYEASLDNGTVFDTTDDDGEPLYLPLDDIVIPGLKEALLLMNTGARWQVVIPPSMGFSRTGNRMFRKRNLIYDIKMISIERVHPAESSN